MQNNVPNGEYVKKERGYSGKMNPSPEFKKSQGYFARMPKDELLKARQKGIEARRRNGVTTVKYSLCKNCDMRVVCTRAYETAINAREKGKDMEDGRARCIYEIENKRKSKAKLHAELQAFIGIDPNDLLMKIQTVYMQLEKLVVDKPSYRKVSSLFYMLTNLYKLKFGDKGPGLSGAANSEGVSIDVKEIMGQIREMEKKKTTTIIDVTPEGDTVDSTEDDETDVNDETKE